MPIISVDCLPVDLPREAYVELIEQLHLEVSAIAELGLHGGDDITVLLPADLCTFGLGEEIVSRVFGLFEKPERTIEIRNRLCQVICEVLEAFAIKYVPQCRKIEALVIKYDQNIDGFCVLKPFGPPTI